MISRVQGWPVLDAAASQVWPQLAPLDEDPIAENPAGKGADCRFHKAAPFTDDLTGRLGQTYHAVSLSSLAVEEDGTTVQSTCS